MAKELKDDRARTISLRLAEAEYEELRKRADASNESLSAYIRRVVFDGPTYKAGARSTATSPRTSSGMVGSYTSVGSDVSLHVRTQPLNHSYS